MMTTLHAAPPSPPVMQWGPHYHGLQVVAGLANVATDQSIDVQVRLAEAVRDRTMMLVTGAPGTGKSFATARAVEAAMASTPLLKAVWIELATSVRGRALAQDLVPQITGVKALPGATLRDLRHLMAEHLAEEHRVLVLDEAQYVTLEAMQLLRWLHDRPDSNFALIIVGTPLLEKRLPPEICSRIMSHVSIGRIPDAQAPVLLAAYHPLFAPADPALLSQLNRTDARGEFRWWAKFVLRAYRYLPQTPEKTLTASNAQLICAELRRGSRA